MQQLDAEIQPDLPGELPEIVTLVLDMDIVKIPQSSEQRKAFEHKLAADLAQSLGVSASRFTILELTAGSVVTDEL